MYRKIIVVLLSVCLLTVATCCPAAAAEFTTYNGNISTSILTYFQDIFTNVGINDNYVLFRESQYKYILVSGELNYNDGTFTLVDIGKQYSLDVSGNTFNSYYIYSVEDISDFSLITESKIVYSDLGNFPQLEKRGERFEVLQTVLICAACLFVVVRSIFNNGKR